VRSPRAHDLLLFSVTNLKSIAAGILEEDGIVMRLFVGRSFDISRARLDCNRRQSIHFRLAVHPKRNPALIGDMSR